INKLEVEAQNASMKKDHSTAIALMKKATALEEQSGAPYGPPNLIKPSHELFGEILLRAGQPKEAVEKFQVALQRQPNRARSLLGLARAAAQSGDAATARATYTKLLEQWKEADADLPELREARDYVKSN
ncbi:MAG TPA: tetratricopeptide repeat protein, partial [Pyrinomonadaceae bacterium]|nr:tetratricopeptide repeat protein [Pyrinomonadaceae bacterium]